MTIKWFSSRDADCLLVFGRIEVGPAHKCENDHGKIEWRKMPKNIVICCDGTGNEFGCAKSNVVKLYQCLACDDTQVTYYHPGVGTMGARNALTRIGKWWTQVLGKAFGYGISDNVADAYQFLMRNYDSGDQLYIFGFSRGAYTARALCGMLFAVGLLTRGNEGLIPYAIRMLKKQPIDFNVLGDFEATFSRDCRAHFLGVWDTVSSVGWVYNAVRFPYTAKNEDFNIVRHAVSIDERRAFFRDDLFTQMPGQHIMQVWFPGVHSDVGGGYAECGLSRIALEWMLGEALAAQLRLNGRAGDVLGTNDPSTAPDPKGIVHKSLHGLWWIAELWPKFVRCHDAKTNQWKNRLRLNLGRRRRIADRSFLHESALQKMQVDPSYHPRNLPSATEIQPRFTIVGTRSLPVI